MIVRETHEPGSPRPAGADPTLWSAVRRLVPSLRGAAVAAVLLLGLIWAKNHSYLLFHSLVELTSVVVAGSAFVVAWNARRYQEDSFLLFLGAALLTVGGLDLVHTLAYTGMGVFATTSADPATQLWLAARYVTAGSFLIAPFLVGRRVRTGVLALAFAAILALALATILVWRVFPTAYVDGQGLTAFKVVSEYVICGLILVAMAALWRRRQAFEPGVLILLIAAMGVTIIQELAFTLYDDPYATWNFVGHCLKLLAFFLLYKAIVETGLLRPFDLLFRDLRLREEELRALNETLEQRVAQRTAEARDRALQLQKMAAQLAGAEERERHRLAQVLHDHLQQLLVAAVMRSRRATERTEDAGCQQSFREITDLVEQSIEASRSLTVELSPPIVYSAGLVAGLEWLQRTTRETHLLELEIAADPRVESLIAQDEKVFLFRAAREFVFNAVKHSGSKRATVTLFSDGAEKVGISVEDEGRGCDPEQALRGRAAGGYGLLSLKERADLLGGELQFASVPGSGTRASLWLPAGDRAPS
ncbi:MAG: MASE3 domain-containing protein [Candidatus Krumholzibacteriia bacterium]